MAKLEPFYLGSTREVKIGLEMSNNSFHLGDTTTTFTAKFYVTGRSDKAVTLQKSALYFDAGDPNSFIAHVPTMISADEAMPYGQLYCTLEGQYKDTEHGNVTLPFVETIAIPAEVVPKYS